MIVELHNLVEAAKAETRAERDTTTALHRILVETEASRHLDGLRGIASQVHAVTAAYRLVRSSNGNYRHDYNDQQNLLAAQLAAFPATDLPKCRHLASANADPMLLQTNPETEAALEIRQAIEVATERLAEATATTNAELARINQSRP